MEQKFGKNSILGQAMMPCRVWMVSGEELFGFFRQSIKNMELRAVIGEHMLNQFKARYQEVAIRRYKMAMVAAFIVGIVSGAVTMIFILSTPADVPLFTFHLETSVLLWFAENSRPIAATALALAMTLSMLSIINNVQDIMRMRGKGAFMPKYSS